MAETLLNLKVKEILTEEGDRERLFEVLRSYQGSQDLLNLMRDLRGVLDEPSKLELYDFLRPLILLRHQIAYSQQAPPSARLRSVRLQRRSGESLGFAVRGGCEHGVGIYVTDVAPASQADRHGLRVGDEIVRVNGFTISEAVHDDVLRLIKSRDDIILKVKYVGMIPVRENASEDMVWSYVDNLNDGSEQGDQENNHLIHKRRFRDLKIFIDSTGHASIGCGIHAENGPGVSYPGIFVDRVRPGSLAEEVGLQAGDQITEVNGTSFRGITCNEAKLAMKSSRQLHFVIRKNNSKVPVVPREEEAKPAEWQPPPPATIEPPVPEQPAVEEPAIPQPTVVPSSEKRLNNNSGDWDEAQIIQHQPNMRAQRQTQGSPTSSASVISISAEVHAVSPLRSQPGKYERLGQTFSAHAPLSGAAAVKIEKQLLEGSRKANLSPRLLKLEGEFGWTDKVPSHIYQQFSSDVLSGRPLNCLTYRGTSDLGIAVEGGVGSPLGGKILVSIVFDDGVAKKSGRVGVGDQLMMLNGVKLLDISSEEADRIINSSTKDIDVKLIYCKSTLVNEEDSVTYF